MLKVGFSANDISWTSNPRKMLKNYARDPILFVFCSRERVLLKSAITFQIENTSQNTFWMAAILKSNMAAKYGQNDVYKRG